MKTRVLIVDDEKNIVLVMRAMLEKAGYEVISFTNSTDARVAIETETVSAVITDLYMPGVSGLELLEYVKVVSPRVPVIMITAYGTVDTAVSSLKKGAFDFITKPFDQTELLNSVKKAVDTFLENEKEPVSQGSGLSAVSRLRPVYPSESMREVEKIIDKVAASPSTVLVTGESGTGKELVALELHAKSDRARAPLVKLNCAAIPENLLENELFGYERGAFPGAVISKPGKFEIANLGTLFLDEVSELSIELQLKLLRVLTTSEYERVGGVSIHRADVRLIAATNKDLKEEVKAGRFREDLYYRLNVVHIHLPPLRERKEDLVPLVNELLAHFNRKLKKTVNSIDSTAMSAFSQYSWPGNMRQLENALERMVLMSEGNHLTLEDCPEEVRAASGVHAKTASVKQKDVKDLSQFKESVRLSTQILEREFIEKALEETSGNVTKAAEKLGLSRKGLQIKLKELGIKRNLTES